MTLNTRLNDTFGIAHPVVLAPMDYIADWRLASAVTRAGGLGLLGGGYGDKAWLDEQFRHVRAEDVGVGFITWSMAAQPGLLDSVIARKPRAIFLSFDDPAAHAPAIRAAGIPLICQVHDLTQARRAVDIGADVIAAQGGEAGGHGTAARSTFTLVPEIADLLHATAPDVLLLAAGGVADGRGLAAALALGADGALVGTRFWAAEEAATPRSAQRQGMSADGDATVRQSAFDIVRHKPWPATYTGRVLRNDFLDQWHHREPALRAEVDTEADRFLAAVETEDYTVANVIVGEGIGQINQIQPASTILDQMVATAADILGRAHTPATI
jgi:nitronate monooxygenase